MEHVIEDIRKDNKRPRKENEPPGEQNAVVSRRMPKPSKTDYGIRREICRQARKRPFLVIRAHFL